MHTYMSMVNGLENVFLKKKFVRDFLGGPVVKNLPYSAGDMGSIPGKGFNIPHAAEQLSLRAATTEPLHYNQRILAPQQEIPYATTKTQPNNLINIKK